MIKFEDYKKLALSLPETTQKPHFDLPSFRVKDKIFGTYWQKEKKAMLRLSPEDQSVFCALDKKTFFPVNGEWGRQGATFVNLKEVNKEMFKDALDCAYEFNLKGTPAIKKEKK